LDYVIHDWITSDNPIDDHWTDITQADFDAYHVSPTYMAARLPPLIIPRAGVIGATTSTAVPPSLSAPARSQTCAELFRQGIKKDPALFPTLKDEKFNDNWHRSFVNQARAQDVSQVLDASYVPNTDEETELFSEKQKYVYAVLEAKVLTDHQGANPDRFHFCTHKLQMFRRNFPMEMRFSQIYRQKPNVIQYFQKIDPNVEF
jgi:hypothetical protein